MQLLLFNLVDDYPSNLFYFAQYVLAFIAVAFYIYFGGNFLRRSKNETNEIQKGFFKGLGFFTISSGISVFLFYLDRVSIYFFNRRIFKAYEFDFSFFSRNYFWVIFAFLLIGSTFLIVPVEKYLMNKPKLILSKLSLIAWIVLPFVRYVELWFGKNIGLIPWIIITFFILINFIILFVMYLRLGINSPRDSSLKSKSLCIVIGLFLWIVGGFTGDVIADQKFDVFGFTDLHMLAPVGPVILIVSLILLIYGFQREY